MFILHFFPGPQSTFSHVSDGRKEAPLQYPACGTHLVPKPLRERKHAVTVGRTVNTPPRTPTPTQGREGEGNPPACEDRAVGGSIPSTPLHGRGKRGSPRGSEAFLWPPASPNPLRGPVCLAGPPSPLQGMQLGAPPLKIIHLKSVLSLTSSSVHEVVRRPLLQHSSLLRSVL